MNTFQGTSTEYNMPEALRLWGKLNCEVLEHAINALVERHESLRTHFVELEGEPVQVVAPSLRITMPVEDVSALEQSRREEAITAALRREREEPFDLARGPLLRIRLLRLGEREHILLSTCHHIVSDGWSVGVFNRELAALYEAFRDGRDNPLAPLPVQYPDYAIWQRQRLQGETLQGLLAYWTNKLASAPPLLAITTDRPRTADRSNQCESRTLELTQELSYSLTTLCQREGVTLFMLLLAAFKVLLSRYSGQEDIVIGAPIGGRNQVVLEDLIGFFVNTLALRTDLSGNPTFREVLTRVRATALDAFAHQDLPFEKLIEKLRPERGLNHTPVFQVFFNMLSFEDVPLSFAGLEVERLVMPEPGAKFDLTLYAWERGNRIGFRAVANVALFRCETIERMLEQLHWLLEQIARNPAECVRNYTLVRPQDRNVLPDPRLPLGFEDDRAIHDGFAIQAKRVPHRTAVVDSKGRWTYAELEGMSNRLANYLRRQGVRRGEVVAVYASPSAALVWSLLGIHKAGALFLILDSAYPAQRLRRFLEKAKPIALLCLRCARTLPEPLEEFARTGALRCRLEVPTEQTLASEMLTDFPRKDPAITVTGADLAYVLFTSGSSGEPLGILGTHQPVSHFLRWHIGRFGLGEDDRFSLWSGLAHDPVLRDIFTPLWLGASLHIPPPEVRGVPVEMSRWLHCEGITVSHLTPAVAELFGEADSIKVSAPDSLRWIFLGGDRLTHGAVQRLRRWAPSCRLVNFYGTTETPQAMGFQMVEANTLADQPTTETVPLGRGIDGAQLLLLNQAGQLAGIGELAEICIRTPYLSKQYLGEDALTRERFQTNPFSGLPGDRIYRTGDMGRYLADGNVSFAGRKDGQVKLRGFRFELGEVEAVLQDCLGVRACAVMLREDQPGDKRLAAYIVGAAPGSVPGTAEMRDYLKLKLPDYMTPSAFVMLERLPLTPNGKIDRKALPVPGLNRSQLGLEYVAPRTPTEELLAGIWAEVLKVEAVGIHDNFFDLGGHSLLAVQMIAKIEQTFRANVPLATLFQLNNVAQIAALIEDRNAAPIGESRELSALASSTAAGLDPGIYRQLLEYTAGWKGQRAHRESLMFGLNTTGTRQPLYWCLQGFAELKQLARYLGGDQPVYGMRSGHLFMEYTPENVEGLAGHYADEILSANPHGPYFLGGNCQASTIALSMARRLQSAGKEVTLLTLLERNGRVHPPYAGPVSLLFGGASMFNPYHLFQNPEWGLRKLFPRLLSIHLIPADHGHFFEEPNIQILAELLRASFTQAQSVVPAPQWDARLLPDSAYQARIATPPSLTVFPGQKVVIPVTVKNTSPLTWHATERSAIALGDHWLRRDGKVLNWSEDRAYLLQDLTPGEAVTLSLPVIPPVEPGFYVLELDLVEEGITWFGAKGSPTHKMLIEVRPECGSVHLMVG